MREATGSAQMAPDCPWWRLETPIPAQNLLGFDCFLAIFARFFIVFDAFSTSF